MAQCHLDRISTPSRKPRRAGARFFNLDTIWIDMGNEGINMVTPLYGLLPRFKICRLKMIRGNVLSRFHELPLLRNPM